MSKKIVALAAMSVGVASIAGAQSFFDDFNRANSGSLGANWTDVSQVLGIDANQAFSVNGAVQSLATVNGISNVLGTYSISLDVTAGSTLSYGAIAMAYAGTGVDQSIFFKLQGSGGAFTNYGFYTGNNLSTGSYTAGGGFFSLAFGYGTARMTMSVAGDVVTVEVDGDINGSVDHTLQATMSGAMMASLGTGAALGVYGAGRADNYNLVVPEPGTFVAIGIGLAGLALARRRK